MLNKESKAPKAPAGAKRVAKKKVCPFCVSKATEINYIQLAKEIQESGNRYDKSGEKRTRYITEKGKIIPRRMSGVCLHHQHLLAVAIKRGRVMALLPFKND
ncbi:MAG: 30S ribosomal protein S18 [Firmicutes bacterium]|nr:30S ribosomal protein S18 [Bacillota bacterium]